jgi:thymidylate kinase
MSVKYGMFFAIEGGDYSGKTTLAKEFVKRNQQSTCTVIVFPPFNTSDFVYQQTDSYIQDAHKYCENREKCWHYLCCPMRCLDPELDKYLAQQPSEYTWETVDRAFIENRKAVKQIANVLRTQGVNIICDRFEDSGFVYGLVNKMMHDPYTIDYLYILEHFLEFAKKEPPYPLVTGVIYLTGYVHGSWKKAMKNSIKGLDCNNQQIYDDEKFQRKIRDYFNDIYFSANFSFYRVVYHRLFTTYYVPALHASDSLEDNLLNVKRIISELPCFYQ